MSDEHVCAYRQSQFIFNSHTSHEHTQPTVNSVSNLNLKQPFLIPLDLVNTSNDSDRSDEDTPVNHTAANSVQQPKVECWGNNEQGQTNVPEGVRDSDLTLLTAGGAHTCTILNK